MSPEQTSTLPQRRETLCRRYFRVEQSEPLCGVWQTEKGLSTNNSDATVRERFTVSTLRLILSALRRRVHTRDDCFPCGTQSIRFGPYFLRGRRWWWGIKRLTIFVGSALLRPAGVRWIITRHNTQAGQAIPTCATEMLRTLHRFSFGYESQVIGEPLTVAVLVDDFNLVAHR
jgi:hypothetical protein